LLVMGLVLKLMVMLLYRCTMVLLVMRSSPS
jgi:hypothetical protein